LPRGFQGLRGPLLARAGAAGLLAAACLFGNGAAHALGFGRLSVQSFQGQPLKAQIQVTSLSPAEQASLQLRVASPQVHRAAGLVVDDVLSSLRAELVRQSDGSFVVELRSDRPVGNVYVDLILEARWASGQRLMGYTLLVSPEGTPPPPVAQVSPVIGAGAAPVGSGGAAAGVAARTSDHVVKYGETLSELAQDYRPEGVSLDQMLVALYQANPQAFMGENMNRLKSGAVLKLPGAEATRAVPPVPARELIEAHSADFGAYRSRLASQVRDAAASETAASRQARGQVQARVQDRKDGAVLTPDQLKLSQGGVKAASSPEAALSREAAAREAAQREAELARNVQALKELQQMAGASSVAAGGQPAASADAASVPGAGPTVAVQVPAAASTVAAASAPASAASGLAVIAVDEPGWLQRLLASPWTVPGAAALVVLMALWGGYRLWRGRRDEDQNPLAATDEPQAPQAEETAPPPLFEPMEEVVEEVGIAKDLDPVAEADVHLAYGSDERAAAVLRTAIEERPERLDLRIKLLEVLALQRDSMSYEPLALELQQMTNGQGSMWEHVKAMGRELDPYNPLYAGKQLDLAGYGSDEPGQAAFDANGEPVLPAELDLNGYGDGDAPGMPALDATPPAEAPELDLNGYGTAAEEDKPAELDLGDASPSEAGSEPVYESVDAEKFGVELGDPLAKQESTLDQGQATDFEREPVDLSQVDLAEIDKADDEPPGVPPPPPPDLSHPLERKLALAKEFLEIGDLEGARDLLDEVYAQATGPLKDSASLLLDTLE
jgi:pilus assembly protein FimV